MNQQDFRKASIAFIEKEGPEVAIKTMGQILWRIAKGVGSGIELESEDEGWSIEIKIDKNSDDVGWMRNDEEQE